MTPTTIHYLPKHGSLWDHWLYRAPDLTYHMYYLYDERITPIEHNPAWLVGHATSPDLVHWTEHTPVLRPSAECGISAIATGSVIAFADRFAMLVTDHDHGIFLAFSPDLHHWEWHTENPVLPVMGDLYETREQMKGNPEGCASWCDPYLFRIPDDTNCYALINTRLREGEMDGRGCIALAKSKDLVHWDILPPILSPQNAMRCETPQILHRNGRWYLIYSAFPHLLTKSFQNSVGKGTLCAAAFVFTAERFDGPYERIGDWILFENESCYICKIIESPDGTDCALTIKCNATSYPPLHGETGITLPYSVFYPNTGGIRIE